MDLMLYSVPLPQQPVPLCVMALAILAASTDIVSRRIPNLLIAFGLVAALAVQFALHGALPGAAIWLGGALTGFGLLLPFYLLRGMAAGDVKLLMMLGAWLGAAAIVNVAVSTFIIGGIWSLGIVLVRGRLMRLAGNVAALITGSCRAIRGMGVSPGAGRESVGSIPYGVAIAAGTVAVMFAMVR
ncbi:prepilin peptidase CpaA [Paraburkholderia unamae]|uniref:Prepilin peptidase CpaA n=2 Tax=Paraburkholderia unamae TaxID=219649 RepID=A0ABX5K9Z1_9BURK|nr:prepilin peptidase CpaA [Paraburkholderia unamae]RAR62373.1 prepilin peptidase CpaA [Paraburkholderia unamae]CAG9245451.1 Peptidase A24 [Paraburkholderia unamae]